MREIIAFILALLVAAPALAIDWGDCTTTFGTQGQTYISPPAAGAVCAHYNSDTDLTSSLLNLNHCENHEVIYNCDINAAVATGCVTGEWRLCVGPTVSANWCDVSEGHTFTGTPPNNSHKGDGGQWGYFVISGDPGADDPIVMVKCND